MAEGSSALHELSNIQNLADAPPVVRTYSFLPIFAKKKVTSFEIPQNVARRQVSFHLIIYFQFSLASIRAMETFYCTRARLDCVGQPTLEILHNY
jgi:hypothetical protein